MKWKSGNLQSKLDIIWNYIPDRWIRYRKRKLERYIATTEAEENKKLQQDILNEIKIIVIFIGIICICVIAIFVSQFSNQKSAEIERNTAGDGESQQKIMINIDDEEYEYEIPVSEKLYTSKEKEEAFEQTFQYLEKEMLKQNKSLKEVRSNLQFLWEIEGSPIEIKWELEDESLIDMEGVVHNKKITSGYQVTHIKAILTYLTDTKEKVYEVRVYPRKISSNRKKAEQIFEQIVTIEEESRTNQSFQIPLNLEGYTIKLADQKNKWTTILLLVIVCGGLLIARQWENEKQKEKKVRVASELEYSNILWQFVLLLEAGFSVQTAWKKIVTDYEKKKYRISEERQYVYNQMSFAYHQLELGYSAEQVFQLFSEKMQLKSYSKLMTLFLQNITKGSKNMLEILRNEEQQAFTIRCEQAKRMGEEADTKLLLPMGIMLLNILLLLMIPAYLQI
jgi:hypothetical protein